MNSQSERPPNGSVEPSQPASTGKSRRTIRAVCYITATLTGLLLVALAPQISFKSRTTASKNACINNLRQIDGAKEQWALENKKTATDTATWQDLVGTDKYIKIMPVCPQNGTYTICSMSVAPACSHLDHAISIYLAASSPGSQTTLSCQASLTLLWVAKQEWQRVNPRKGLPTEAALQKYMGQVYPSPSQLQFSCDAGGKFIIGGAKENPRCSIPGHTLP